MRKLNLFLFLFLILSLCFQSTGVYAQNKGTPFSWGSNKYGQLGNGISFYTRNAVQVLNLNNITKIDSGLHFSLALKNDGSVWTWGDNRYGQLGNRTFSNSSVPVQVLNLTNVIAISLAIITPLH